MKNLGATTDRMVGPVRHPTWTKLISAMIWLAVENSRTSIRRSLEGSERNAGLSDSIPSFARTLSRCPDQPTATAELLIAT
jgi:hypothetical protein